MKRVPAVLKSDTGDEGAVLYVTTERSPGEPSKRLRLLKDSGVAAVSH